ncbi:ANR family transcriptional regulator [Vibrio sp. ZSDZ65]|uniref:ANR family transcriptional regulator n=1 Tax=Vibrio qingdaonensis TaxID=2829491 RepID=A0A9X3CSG1_9VIBR|nr:ANR family transcriptional regulator [Vibrio qingdaonensis]MCW8348719.1 ANR family transcriptional regulator [Vibrio qingdaonensis]
MHFHQQPGMKNRYYDLAREAAELERNQEYQKAAIAWKRVSDIATKSINIKWAENRHEFCLKYKPITSSPKRGRPKTQDVTT